MLMLSRDFTVRLSTAQTVHEAEQRKSQLAHKKVQMALRAAAEGQEADGGAEG